MILEQIVTRMIPDECIKRVLSGALSVKGGAVYDGSHIVKHLQFAGDTGLVQGVSQIASGPLGAMGQAIGALQSLATASLALNGLNLAVSVAGFAIVCHKLNHIAERLEEMNSKLDQLLAGQARLEWRQEIERHARTGAAIENFALGLRTGRQALVEDAILRLTESSVVYRRVSTALLADVSLTYRDPTPFQQMVQQALACDLAKAQALAHLGHLGEAEAVADEAREWHQTQLLRIEEPLRKSPVWLGLLSDSQARAAHGFVRAQRAIQPAITYAKVQFEVCRMIDTRLDELALLPGDAPYVVISLDELREKAPPNRKGKWVRSPKARKRGS